MTHPNFETDGAAPSGMDLPVFRSAREMAVGLSLAGAAILATGLIAHAPVPAGVVEPAKVAAQAVRPLIPPGPAVAALAPDSHAVLQALLKQAGLRPTLDPHKLSWDQARKVNALLPQAHAAPDLARPFHVDVSTKDGRQALTCLTQAAYYEAGANGPEAQAAVAQVVLNRLRHPDFPKSVCGVVYEGAERASGCQFTFTCDGALKRPVDGAAWNGARKVAEQALAGHVDAAAGTATYYHADYVFPTWAPTLVKMGTVGPHIFYRMAGPEGAAAYLTGQYAGNELKLVRAVLRAADKHTQKAEPAAQAEVKQANTEATRIQRVRAEIAASTPKADPTPVVETASLKDSIQTTLKAAETPAPVAPDSPPAA